MDKRQDGDRTYRKVHIYRSDTDRFSAKFVTSVATEARKIREGDYVVNRGQIRIVASVERAEEFMATTEPVPVIKISFKDTVQVGGVQVDGVTTRPTNLVERI